MRGKREGEGGRPERQAPAWVSLLARWCLPAERREDVVGDLEEIMELHLGSRGRGFGSSARAWLLTSLDALQIFLAFPLLALREALEGLAGISWLEIKLGLRLLRKQPWMALTCVAALGLGIGIATTGFAFLDAMVFAELPVPRAEAFLRLESHLLESGRWTHPEPELYAQLRGSPTYVHVGAGDGEDMNILYPSGEVESLRGNFLTPDTFGFLAYSPLLGRLLGPEDGMAGAAPVVLLRESLWKRRFSGRGDVLGEVVHVSGEARTVVGVLPDEAGFPAGGELWIPLNTTTLGGNIHGPRRGLTTFCILAEESSLKGARAELATLAATLPVVGGSELRKRYRLAPFAEADPGEVWTIGLMLCALVLLLIVIAANVANLVLARTMARQGELAVRTALGASRSRLIGQLAAEVTLLGAMAAVLGVGGAWQALTWVDGHFVSERPFWISFSPSPRAVLFVLALTLLATTVGGVLPALRATRKDPARVMAAYGPGSGGFGFGRFGATMVVLEMAISVALLSGALAIAQGFAAQHGEENNTVASQILTAQILGGKTEPGEGESWVKELPLTELSRAASELPGVIAAGLGTALPGEDPWQRRVLVAGLDSGEGPEGSVAARVPVVRAEPGFLQAVDARVLAGRGLEPGDLLPGAPPVAVINQAFAEMHFAGANPIGRRVGEVEDRSAGPKVSWREVVGVVRDAGLSAFDPQRSAGYYVPLRGPSFRVSMALRSAGPPSALVQPLRQALTTVDPLLRLTEVVPLESLRAREKSSLAVFGQSISAMGLFALLLSLASLYAMVALAVSRRVREIGIRVALGASRGRILTTVMGRVAVHLSLGALLGGVFGFGLLFAQNKMFAFRLPSQEVLLLSSVLGLFLLAGALACWLPARRALRVQPSEALRAK